MEVVVLLVPADMGQPLQLRIITGGIFAGILRLTGGHQLWGVALTRPTYAQLYFADDGVEQGLPFNARGTSIFLHGTPDMDWLDRSNDAVAGAAVVTGMLDTRGMPTECPEAFKLLVDPDWLWN